MRRLVLMPATAALAVLVLAGCSSSDDAPEPTASAASESVAAEEPAGEAAADAPATGATVTGEEWLAAITEAEAAFFDAAADRALHVSIEVSDTQQGTAIADTTYNPDDTFVATSTMTAPDGTASTMDVACTVEKCFQRADGGEWTEADRSLVERPVAGAIATALQELEATGTVTHTMGDGTFTAEVDVPEAEDTPGGTASLTETITDTEMSTTMLVNVGTDSSTTTSTMTFTDPAPLPDDLP